MCKRRPCPHRSLFSSANPTVQHPLPKLEQPYLLWTYLPYYLDSEGHVWLDRLWQRDFVAHRTYIRRLILAAPCRKKESQADLVRLLPEEEGQVEFFPLPWVEHLLSAVWKMPRMSFILWKAIGKARIVHSAIIGWPFCYTLVAWLVNCLALLRGKKLFLVVESAGWRIARAEGASWITRLRAGVTEWLGRACVNRADLVLFTQPSYRESLLTHGRGSGIVIPASWINEEEIIDRHELKRLWERKDPLGREECRFLFVGRLAVEKGVQVLLRAMKTLDIEGISCRIDILGQGPLRDECIEEIQSLSSVEASVLEPVPYGERFFELLRGYHCILVPSLSDEQPRIVFDSYSQGLPVLAADTDGLRPYIDEGRTGWLVRKNDAGALASRIREVIERRGQLKEGGVMALEEAHRLTHREMHRRRWEVLVEHFGDK